MDQPKLTRLFLSVLRALQLYLYIVHKHSFQRPGSKQKENEAQQADHLAKLSEYDAEVQRQLAFMVMRRQTTCVLLFPGLVHTQPIRAYQQSARDPGQGHVRGLNHPQRLR